MDNLTIDPTKRLQAEVDEYKQQQRHIEVLEKQVKELQEGQGELLQVLKRNVIARTRLEGRKEEAEFIRKYNPTMDPKHVATAAERKEIDRVFRGVGKQLCNKIIKKQ